MEDKRQWANFWIGFLVFILTAISIAFGTASAVYSVKLYNLTVAQAYAAQDAAKLLPAYLLSLLCAH